MSRRLDKAPNDWFDLAFMCVICGVAVTCVVCACLAWWPR